MRIIVENLLLLQRTSSTIELYKEPLYMMVLLDEIQQRLAFKYSNITSRMTINIQLKSAIIADEFSLKTILTNLIDNALFYSLPDDNIKINVLDNTQQISIEVVNIATIHYSTTELEKVNPTFVSI